AGTFEEALYFAAAAAFPPSEGDVRVEGAAIGFQAEIRAGAINLGGERRERRLRFDAGPQRAGVALFETAGAADAQVECTDANPRERGGDVFGQVAVDLPDESQGQVKLLIALPAEVGAGVHGVDQKIANELGRTDCDEQAGHAQLLAPRPLLVTGG